MVVLAVGIGNLDMHTKNLGLLHPLDDEVRLAPAYDVVPQAHQATAGELALAVNQTYRLAAITQDDLVAEVAAWGLRQATGIVADALDALVHDEVPLDGAHPALQDEILQFIGNLRRGAAVGRPR